MAITQLTIALLLFCSKYYEKEALLADPVDGAIFASLLCEFSAAVLPNFIRIVITRLAVD